MFDLITGRCLSNQLPSPPSCFRKFRFVESAGKLGDGGGVRVWEIWENGDWQSSIFSIRRKYRGRKKIQRFNNNNDDDDDDGSSWYMVGFCSRKFEEKRFSRIEIQIQNGTMGKSPVRINWPIIWREMREADHQSWFKGRLRRCVWNRVGSIIGSRLRIQFSAAPPFTATSRLFAYNDRLHWHFDDQLWVKRSTSLSSNTRAFRSMHARVCGTSGNQRSRKADERRAENNSFWIYRLDGESSGIYGVWRPSIQTRYD